MSIRLALLTAISLISACSETQESATYNHADQTFVGSEKCVSCHEIEYRDWRGSHHQLAMQTANSETVLGDFNNASLKYNDSRTRFIMDSSRFLVETKNETGELQSFEVTHAFGITPLQQYLVETPGGRKQALPFAWDTRPLNDGGQRWYAVYTEDDIDYADPLHWTGRYFNWNYMCAECHSTNVETGYDVESDSFTTTFSEISVGCEACHGPGSTHTNQAQQNAFDSTWGLAVDLDDRKDAAWVINPESGMASRSTPNISKQQPESCGRCHSRRSIFAREYEYGKPLSDTHRVSLLDEHLYFADGRIQDEVYVYGSFVQSKMYAAGVTCSDCHNPHSGELHAGPNPNDTCAQCHLAAKFASIEHQGEANEQCVDCHMPATIYMGVDDRRDHSFRLPGTERDPDHYGSAIAAGRAGSAQAELLAAIASETYPGIARATMLTLLEPGVSPAQLAEQFADPDPLVRIAALRALRYQPPQQDKLTASHLLHDPVRGVRIAAVSLYVDYRDLLQLEDARAFSIAADEFREALQTNLSMPDAAVNLAEFETRMGNNAAAEKLFGHALRVGSNFAPAHYAYGLLLVRSGQPDTALDHLRTAVELAPNAARYTYVFGVALNSQGQSDEAVRVLQDAHERFKDDFDIAWALATIYRDRGELQSSMSVARELVERFPGNDQAATLLEALRR